jgi:hypothetical protein
MHELVRTCIGVGLSLACGCGGAPRGGAARAPRPVRFLAVQGATVKLIEATSAGLRELRSVQAPAEIGAVEWVGAEPVVMLEAFGEGEAARHGEIGRITERGYEPFAALPAATWEITPAPEGFDHFHTPHWKLIVSADGSIWQGRCEWGYFGDGDACTEFVYARLSPPPVATVREEPRSGRPVFRLAPTPPFMTTQVVLVNVDRPPTEDEPKREPITILRCTQAGKTTEYPPADDREHGLSGEITWLSTEPPMYLVERWDEGEEPYLRSILFEGCAESPTFASAKVEPGPGGVFAIIGEQTSIRWGERELGRLEGGGQIRFAPAP